MILVQPSRMMTDYGCRHFHLNIGRNIIYKSNPVRYYLSCTKDVPIDSNVQERPCRLVLAEDLPLLLSSTSLSSSSKNSFNTNNREAQQQLRSSSSSSSSSWKDHFSTVFPNKYGIPFSYFTTTPTTTETTTRSIEMISTMNDAILEMKKDLSHDTILIARGPWISWLVQYYIEDLSLNGLILIDPIPLNVNNYLQQFEHLLVVSNLNIETKLRNSNNNNNDKTELLLLQQQYNTTKQLFNDYIEHWDHWTLKLEPGSVPILILTTNDFIPQQQHQQEQFDVNDKNNTIQSCCTTNRIIWNEMAEYAAKRHSDTGNDYSHHRDVPIYSLDTDDDNSDYTTTQQTKAEILIHDWILNRVL